jgi:hypothetical protein
MIMHLTHKGAKMQNLEAVTEQRVDYVRREEIAAQIVGMMEATFTLRPGPDEMKEILRCAAQQIDSAQIVSQQKEHQVP